MDSDIKQQIHAYVDEVWPQVMADIAELVSHRSVEDLGLAAPGAPWGPGPRAALSCALAQAERLGLEVHDCDGYMGYADVPGASTKQLATIAHVDVVPEGPGWHTDPYKMEVRDGYLLGRGVIDDKGPAVLSMYAAHFFKRLGVEQPYTLRVMLGANEETGMGDVEYYLEHFDQPAFLFTPDAEYPVCCGEKGLYSATFVSPVMEDGVIVEFEGGTVSNAIPSLAHAIVRASAANLPAADDITITDNGDGTATIEAHGIGGHASLPEGTRNAIGMVVNYLLANNLCCDAERDFLSMEQVILSSTDGSTLGIAATDDIFDPLTCIGGTMRTADGRFSQTVDSRYPKSIDSDTITAKLKQLADAHSCELKVDRAVVPFYVDPSSPEITTLVDCYNETFGRDAHAFTIGGGTYARHFANAASFGPEEPALTDPEWVGQMHGPDEGVSEKLLRDSLELYIYAITKLMQLDL